MQVMDKHLNILAKQHLETRFLKIHAEKSPFLTDKLRIIVLPTLALVKDAKVEDYVVSIKRFSIPLTAFTRILYLIQQFISGWI